MPEEKLLPGKVGISVDYIKRGDEGTIIIEGTAYKAKAYDDIEKARTILVINTNPLLVTESRTRLYRRSSMIFYNGLTGVGVICNLVPAKDNYIVLQQISTYAADDGAVHILYALDESGTWRTVDGWMFIENSSMIIPFPDVKLEKFKSFGVEYKVKKGDGSTATVRLLATVGTGIHSATMYYYEES